MVLLDSGLVSTSEDCCCGGGGCCDFLEPFTTITVSGNVIGCGSGGGSMGLVMFNRVVAPPGCDLSIHEWSKDSNCGCLFQAQNCVPFIEVSEVHTDNTNDNCLDPNYGRCGLIAAIDCGTGKVQFFASSIGLVCCDQIANLTTGLYDIPGSAGSIDDTLTSDDNPAISFHFTLDFA